MTLAPFFLSVRAVGEPCEGVPLSLSLSVFEVTIISLFPTLPGPDTATSESTHPRAEVSLKT